MLIIFTGGGSSLSQRDRKDIHAEVDAEFEAEGKGLHKKKRKNIRKNSDGIVDDLGSLFGDGITGKPPRYANKITLKVLN